MFQHNYKKYQTVDLNILQRIRVNANGSKEFIFWDCLVPGYLTTGSDQAG